MVEHDDAAAPQDGQPQPYREMTDEQYADWVARHFTVEEVQPGTLVLRGPCPRCHAIIDIPVVNDIFQASRRRGGRLWRRAPSTVDHEEPMLCTCEEPHPGRPDKADGCGAYWTVMLSRQDG